MFAERLCSVMSVEVWAEFDDETPSGLPCKARVYTKGLVGRKLWLKVYDRNHGIVAEYPPRGNTTAVVKSEPDHDITRGGQIPPPLTRVASEELDLSFPYVTLEHRKDGALGLWLARQVRRGASKEALEARLGRKLLDPEFFPSCGLSVKAQGWP